MNHNAVMCSTCDLKYVSLLGAKYSPSFNSLRCIHALKSHTHSHLKPDLEAYETSKMTVVCWVANVAKSVTSTCMAV